MKNNPDTPQFSIGTVARMLNISVQSLRLYESEGLLAPFKTEGHHRLYSENDIERIRCIKKTINEEKISIAGMRRIHAMIPCWQITNCSVEERTACPAYNRFDGGCWTHKDKRNSCSSMECRLCEVYKMSSDCGKIKQLISNIQMPT